MTIKQKLIGLLLIPLLAFIFVGVGQIFQANRTAHHMTEVSELAQLAVKVGELVHETQKERGRTAGFLGSQGQKFRQELNDQRQLTDAKASALTSILQQVNLSAQPERFQTFFNQAVSEIGRVAEVRRQVDDLSIPASQAIGYYTAMNAAFLNAVSIIADSQGKEAFQQDILAFSQFLKAKERAGIERAVLSNTFARDSFGTGMYQKLIGLITEQNNYLAGFELYADEGSLAKYQEVQQDPAFAEVLRLREIAQQNAQSGGFGVDAAVWFKTITDKINQLKQLENYIEARLLERAETLKQQAEQAQLGYIGVIVVLLAVLLVLGYFTMRSILQPINNVVYSLQDIAEGEGDLTQRVAITGKDELAELAGWFNVFIGNVQGLVKEVKGASLEVASASEEIAASSEQMSQSMNDQANQVDVVVSSMDEMRKSIDEVAQKCVQAATNATTSGELALSGGNVVGETIDGMQAISQVVRSGAEVVTALGQQGEKIGEIIDVINDIAAQTNLLALNAAIEAARAGEHGRGFAVVADEVRKLAERTTEATEQVAHSIEGIQSGTSKAVNQMNQGTERVDSGVQKAGEAEQSLQSIVGSAQEVADMIHVIASAVEEQTYASESINESMNSISDVSAEAQLGASQSAAATVQLSSKASQLQQLVERFQV